MKIDRLACLLVMTLAVACSKSTNKGGGASVECADDTDCDGNDLCEDGECISATQHTSGVGGATTTTTGIGAGTTTSGSGAGPTGSTSSVGSTTSTSGVGGATTSSSASSSASSGVGGGTGDCCASQATPGCNDAFIQQCVCARDPYCCQTKWNYICVAEAGSDCGGCGGAVSSSSAASSSSSGGGSSGTCCTANASAGCSDGAVEQCVCAFDSYCCTNSWDGTCVNEGLSSCGAICP